MTDYFALLNFPRRPWLDADALKQRFHELSTEVHPDRAHDATDEAKAELQRRFAEVNAAHQCLREAKSRVRHLLELELGRAPGNVKSIPGEMTEWFMEIGAVCREVDAFLAKKEAQDSPLLQAALMGEGMALNDKVTELHGRLQSELAAGPAGGAWPTAWFLVEVERPTRGALEPADVLSCRREGAWPSCRSRITF